MQRDIKKQLWLSKEENNCLKESTRKSCLTESDYIRMLLRNRVPKEKPDAEFYEAMSRLREFTEQLQVFSTKLSEIGNCDAEGLQSEIKQWHQFQLDIQKRFLLPEEVKWL